MSEARWVDGPDQLQELVEELGSEDRFAIDTEFHRERTYFPQLALLQLAWDGGVALVDPLAVDVRALAPLLTGPATVVAHAADQDVEVLRYACGAPPARVFDTQLAAGFLGMSTPSLTVLVNRRLGISLPKGDRLTDWNQRPLTPDQLEYAASDVTHLLPLHDAMVAELRDRGRLEWVEQECEEVRVRASRQADPEVAWWRLRDARQLRGAARGVAQEVAAWRERRAARLDRPSRFVLPDMVLTGIAHRPPRDAAGLSRLRGLDGRSLPAGVADEVLAAVKRGLALPPGALRQPPSNQLPPELRAAVALVLAWVAQLGRDLEIDPGLLATRGDVEALLTRRRDARLASGWRAGLVGEPIRRLVEGEAALAFDGKGGLVLEERSRQPFSPG